MSTLQGFPMVSQLTTITSDGRPSEDAQFDCVPASIGAGLLWYEGKSQWDKDINPDMLKDTAYGENWKNDGTAAVRYLPVLAKMGYTLQAVNGIPGDLVSKVHQQIQDQKPVIFTEPDPYVSASLNWTHVCVFFAEESGYLTAMDPYIAKAIRRTDKEWTELLLNNQIWVLDKLEKEDDMLSIDLNIPEVSAHFKQQNATSWVCLQTGKAIHDAMLTFYRSFGRNDCCGLTFLGLPVSNEIPLGGGVTKQFFERGVLVYDPQRKIDNPTKSSGAVYLAHLYEGPGVDPKVAELQKQLADAQSATQNSASLTIVKQIQQLVKPF